MKTYKVSACRHPDYGETVIGHFSSRKKAEKAKETGYAKARKHKDNREDCKCDGYFEADWNIEEIEVK